VVPVVANEVDRDVASLVEAAVPFPVFLFARTCAHVDRWGRRRALGADGLRIDDLGTRQADDVEAAVVGKLRERRR